MYRISLSNKIELSIRKDAGHIKIKNYKGKVFCFSTKTGFFITRRNGKIAIQGNTLSAQTSVLAAGNPKFGRFEPMQPISAQIDLPPALISRFDLIFVLRDLPNLKQDDAIASHVLKMHQKNETHPPVERDLFRKYVACAKKKYKPVLTDEAVEEIKNFYVKLRNMQATGDGKGIPITARQLQGLVRLAEAHAKMRLSNKVKKEDAQISIELTEYYLRQAGYDPETKTFDIDKAMGGTSSGKRGKIYLIKNTISELAKEHGQYVPEEALKEKLENELSEQEIEEGLRELIKKSDIYEPKPGYYQLM